CSRDGRSKAASGRLMALLWREWYAASGSSILTTPWPTTAIAMSRRFSARPRPSRHVIGDTTSKRQHIARRHLGRSKRGPPLLRQADRAVGELRGAGGHRDGECTLHNRDARGLRTADRDRRGVAGHQLLARRSETGL